MSGEKWAVVTGGAGFIGSHLAEALIREGRRVRVVDDFSTGLRVHAPSGAEIVEGDVVENAERAVRDADVVFHLASLPSVRHPKSRHTMAESTVALLAAAEDAGVRRMVIASSSAVFGAVPFFAPPDRKPVPLSPCALAKICGELYVEYWASRRSLETVTVRFFNVYGPRQNPEALHSASVPIFLRRLLRGERLVVFGDGLQTRHFSFVDDVVRALVASASAGGVSGRVYNLAGGRAVSILKLVYTMARILRVTPAVDFLPARPGDIHYSWVDISAARRDLGFTPGTTLESGLRDTARWFEEAHLLRG